jgi:hypothetical protein
VKQNLVSKVGLVGLWSLTPNTTIYQLNCVVSFIGGGTGVPAENHRPVARLYHIMLYRVHLTMDGIRNHKFSGGRYWLHWVVIYPTTIRSRPRRPLVSNELLCTKSAWSDFYSAKGDMSLHSALFCHKAPNTKAFVSTWTSYGIVLAIYEGLIERGNNWRFNLNQIVHILMQI